MRQIKWATFAVITAVLSASGAEVSSIIGTLGSDGTLRLTVNEKEIRAFNAGVYDKGWKGSGAAPVKSAPDDGAKHFAVQTTAGSIDGTVRCQTGAEFKDGAKLSYEFTPNADVELNSLHVSADFAVAALAGG